MTRPSSGSRLAIASWIGRSSGRSGTGGAGADLARAFFLPPGRLAFFAGPARPLRSGSAAGSGLCDGVGRRFVRRGGVGGRFVRREWRRRPARSLWSGRRPRLAGSPPAHPAWPTASAARIPSPPRPARPASPPRPARLAFPAAAGSAGSPRRGVSARARRLPWSPGRAPRRRSGTLLWNCSLLAGSGSGGGNRRRRRNGLAPRPDRRIAHRP